MDQGVLSATLSCDTAMYMVIKPKKCAMQKQIQIQNTAQDFTSEHESEKIININEDNSNNNKAYKRNNESTN